MPNTPPMLVETVLKPVLFQAITSSVEMKDNATGSVRVTYYSSCVGDGPIRQTNKCSGLRVGSKVQFTGNFETLFFISRNLNPI